MPIYTMKFSPERVIAPARNEVASGGSRADQSGRDERAPREASIASCGSDRLSRDAGADEFAALCVRFSTSRPPERCVSRRRLLGAAILLPLLALRPAHGETLAPNHAVQRMVEAALAQTRITRFYDPAYVKLPYPGGDPPPDRGVCSDVVIRALRAAGVDLQREVHDDMQRHFARYPQLWGLRAPDANIDHRRVANLMMFFTRKGKSLPITGRDADYRAGDIVAWDLGGGLLHLGIVVDEPANPSGGRRLVHNIGAGTRIEDVLFRWRIIGHYRYF